MRKVAHIILFPVLNYFVAFIVFPYVVLEVTTELVSLFALALWLIIVTVLERKYLFIRHILLGIIPMWFLVLLYCPNGLYGIGNDGILDFSPKEIDALLVCVAITMVQVTTELCIRLYHAIRTLIRRNA